MVRGLGPKKIARVRFAVNFPRCFSISQVSPRQLFTSNRRARCSFLHLQLVNFSILRSCRKMFEIFSSKYLGRSKYKW